MTRNLGQRRSDTRVGDNVPQPARVHSDISIISWIAGVKENSPPLPTGRPGHVEPWQPFGLSIPETSQEAIRAATGAIIGKHSDSSFIEHRRRVASPIDSERPTKRKKHKRPRSPSEDNLPSPQHAPALVPRYEKQARHKTRLDRYEPGRHGATGHRGNQQNRRRHPTRAQGSETKHCLRHSREVANNFESRAVHSDRLTVCLLPRLIQEPRLILADPTVHRWGLWEWGRRFSQPTSYVSHSCVSGGGGGVAEMLQCLNYPSAPWSSWSARAHVDLPPRPDPGHAKERT